MPNWCSNKVKVSGPKKSLDAFKATLNTPDANGEKTSFSFHQTVPMPADCFRGNLSMEDEAKHPCNWRSFGISTWGCKWDVSDAVVEIHPKSVEIWFDTAWSPPVEWLENVAKKFPELTFDLAYCEGGMGFYGNAMACDGEMCGDNSNDFPSGTFNDDGELQAGEVKKHVAKYDLGMGG